MRIKQFTIILLASLGLLLGAGCGTDTPTKITQADQPFITGVNDFMAEWRDYVNAGKATQKQIDKVHAAYDAYYAAQQSVKAVVLKLAAKDPTATAQDATDANQAVQDAEAALLGLVHTFIIK